jgi:hypothetical protein
VKGCRCSLGSIGQRLAALFGQCVRDHCWHGDQSFGQYGYSRREKQGESRPWLTAIAPHRGYWPFHCAGRESRSTRPHQPGISCLPIRSTQTPGTSLELTGLSPAWRSAQGPRLSRADRQHAASARARVRDRSHNARLVQGLVVVREDQGDHQANELTRRAIATSRSIAVRAWAGLGPRRDDDAE